MSGVECITNCFACVEAAARQGSVTKESAKSVGTWYGAEWCEEGVVLCLIAMEECCYSVLHFVRGVLPRRVELVRPLCAAAAADNNSTVQASSSSISLRPYTVNGRWAGSVGSSRSVLLQTLTCPTPSSHTFILCAALTIDCTTCTSPTALFYFRHSRPRRPVGLLPRLGFVSCWL